MKDQARWAMIARQAVYEAKRCRETAQANNSRNNWITHREAQVVGGIGNDREGEPDYIDVKALSGIRLRMICSELVKRYPRIRNVCIQGGCDLWETFQEFVNQREGFDYVPEVEVWDISVPDDLLATLR